MDTTIVPVSDLQPEPLSHDRQLQLLSEGRALIAQARTVPDAKQIRDQAQLYERYFRQQRDAEQAALDAGELKLRAERKLGELLANRDTDLHPVSRERLLPEDVSHAQSHRWQRIHSLPEPVFEEHLALARRAGEMTASPLLELAKQRDREAKRAERKRSRGGAAACVNDDRCRVEQADCLDWFAAQPADGIDLVFGSPPYEDARLYLEGGKNLGAARDTEQWVAWMVEVYEAALRCCKGLVAFVVEGRTKNYQWTASPALLIAALVAKKIPVRKPPIYRRVGIPGSGGPDWLRNDYEFIVCATRGGPLPWDDNTAMGEAPKYGPGGEISHRTQDGRRVNQIYTDRDASQEERNNVGPHRARRKRRREAGKGYVPPELSNPGNVIDCGAVGGGKTGDALCHENEAPFPEELARFFVLSFCRPGGLVCDPFCGSGTTLAVALAEGRRAAGCDLRRSQVELTRDRLAAAAPGPPA
jgi:hypothetical protein